MDRMQLRKDLVATLAEHDLFIHKFTWAEDLLKDGLQLTMVAGGVLGINVQEDLPFEDAR